MIYPRDYLIKDGDYYVLRIIFISEDYLYFELYYYEDRCVEVIEYYDEHFKDFKDRRSWEYYDYLHQHEHDLNHIYNVLINVKGDHDYA